MTNETQQSDVIEQKPIPFGMRLKSAREAKGLERKDAAAQLRLNEKVIIMLEKDRYPADLPVTFIRGYMRSYGKFLDIPEYEIKKAVEPIKPKPSVHTISSVTAAPPVTSGNYFMQLFTYLIVLTLLGLVGTWWFSRVSQPIPNQENQFTTDSTVTPPDIIPVTPPVAAPTTIDTNSQAPVVPGHHDAAAAATPAAHDNTPSQNAEETHAATPAPAKHPAYYDKKPESDTATDSTDANSDANADANSDESSDNTDTISDNAD